VHIVPPSARNIATCPGIEYDGGSDRGSSVGRVFISHNHIDDPFVDKLASDLESRSIAVFVDHRALRHGQHWPTEVESALNDCEQMVAVISDYSKASKNCIDEWNVFIEDHKEIIPVWLSGDKMYFRLRTVHYIDFRTLAYEEALQRLVEALTDTRVDTVLPGPLTDDSDDQDSVLNSRLALRYPLARCPDKAVGIATGNIAEIAGADVLVNSENNRLKMDRIESHSVSAALNAFGAEWDANGELVRETIDLELQAARRDLPRTVPLTTVVVTSAGSLRNTGVRHLLHAVTTISKRNSGFEAGTAIQLGQCVTKTLMRIDQLNSELYQDSEPLRTVVFPILGTGDGGLSIEAIAPSLVARAIDHFELWETRIAAVYFVAHQPSHFDRLRAVFNSIPDLSQPVV
jgi:O-acetyl-ADP-ribose deacetylase (regulator of RNase III)